MESNIQIPIFDVLWGVALFGVGVVDLSQGASVLTGRYSVQTDVELLTIGMSVTRMDLCGTIGIELLLLGAGETIGQNWSTIVSNVSTRTHSLHSTELPSSRTQPTRATTAGHPHTPAASLKTKLAGHLFKLAWPSMQVKNSWQLLSTGCWKKPFRRRQFSLGWAGSVYKSLTLTLWC